MAIFPRFLALVSALVLPLALVVVWADQFVTDTSGYVETVGPLAEDREVQEAAAARLAAATNSVVRAQIGPRAATTAGGLTEDVALAVVDSDAFAVVWRNSNGAAHRQFEKVMGGDRDAPVVLDLSPVVDEALAGMRDAGVPLADVDVSNSLRIRLASSDSLERVRAAYTTIDRFGLLLAGLWCLLLLGAIALARDRRGVVATAGAATAVTTALLYLALWLGDEVAVSSISPSDRPLVRAVYDVLTEDLELWTLIAVGASVVITVLCAVLPRGRAAPVDT